MNTESAREKYWFYNSLAILLKAVENERTVVDLRNEASVYGTVEHADAYMNVVMKDCVFTDPRGDRFKYDTLFVQARNIRFVHIPANIRIIPAIKDQLGKLKGTYPTQFGKPKRTFKSKRAQQRQEEDVASVMNILETKKTVTPSDDNKGGTE